MNKIYLGILCVLLILLIFFQNKNETFDNDQP